MSDKSMEDLQKITVYLGWDEFLNRVIELSDKRSIIIDYVPVEEGPPKATGNCYYIGPHGDDANDGESYETAKASLEAMKPLVQPGDTIIVGTCDPKVKEWKLSSSGWELVWDN